MSPEELKASLAEHCLGPDSPAFTLLATGEVAAQWVVRYRELLREVSALWRAEPLWPREVVTAIHFSSFYLELRYAAWRETSGRNNPDTEGRLATIRSTGELFLMEGASNLTSGVSVIGAGARSQG
jgi:hypothetical protein